jgi:hypothetical protein
MNIFVLVLFLSSFMYCSGAPHPHGKKEKTAPQLSNLDSLIEYFIRFSIKLTVQ